MSPRYSGAMPTKPAGGPGPAHGHARATEQVRLPATRFPAAWLSDRDLTGDLIRVVTLVQDYGWKSGLCFAADETIGRQLGLSRGGVNRLIAKAKAKNLVRASRNPATRTMNRRVRPLANDELAVCVGSYARAHLAGTRFKVYALLSLRQQFTESTPVARIARECQIKEDTAREAVAELLVQGWVSRGQSEKRGYRYVVHPMPVRVPSGPSESLPNGPVPALRSADGPAGGGVEVFGSGPDSLRGASLGVCREAPGSATAGSPSPVTLSPPDPVTETRSPQHDVLNMSAVVGGCSSREPETARPRARGRAAGATGGGASPAGHGTGQADQKMIQSMTNEQRRWGQQAASSALGRLPRQLADRLTERHLDLLTQHIVATFTDYSTSPEVHGAVILKALESACEFARRREPVGAVPWSSVVSPLPWLIRVVDRASETVTGTRPVRSPECALCRGPLVVRDAEDPETCRSCGPAAAAAACRRLREQWELSGHQWDAPPLRDPLTAPPAPVHRRSTPTAAPSGLSDRMATEGDESEGTVLRRRLAARRLEREQARARAGEDLSAARTAFAGPRRQGATEAARQEGTGRGSTDQARGHDTGLRDAPLEAVAASDPAPRRDGRPDAGKAGVVATARPGPARRHRGTSRHVRLSGGPPVAPWGQGPTGRGDLRGRPRDRTGGRRLPGESAVIIADCRSIAGAVPRVSRVVGLLRLSGSQCTVNVWLCRKTGQNVIEPAQGRSNVRWDWESWRHLRIIAILWWRGNETTPSNAYLHLPS
ncbi:putative DNA-binding transcriptional regulator [Kitasatospora sp. MAA19]|nr:putative DNA-binding transcriptional regulator [Kitasatospora sp. MAA19]